MKANDREERNQPIEAIRGSIEADSDSKRLNKAITTFTRQMINLEGA